MKKLNLLKSLLVSVFGLTVFNAASAKTGGLDTGGGSAYEAEFKYVGYQIYDQIQRAGLGSDELGFAPVNFGIVLKETRIFSADSVSLDENLRGAINSKATKIILLNETIWAQLQSVQKNLLVMHEYMRFLNLDDSQYEHSTLVFRRLSIAQVVPQIIIIDPGLVSARVEKCQSIALGMSSYSLQDATLFKCIDSHLSEMSVNDCMNISLKMSSRSNQNTALWMCKHRLSQRPKMRECMEIANKMTSYSEQDKVLFQCVEEFKSRVPVDLCLEAAQKMSSYSNTNSAKTMCLDIFLK